MWHCIEAPYSLEVSEPLMRRAVEFVTRFVIPSLRYTFDGDYGGAVGLEKWCASMCCSTRTSHRSPWDS